MGSAGDLVGHMLARLWATRSAGTADGSVGAPEGIDRAGIEDWFAEHVPDAEPPLAFELISGGIPT